MPFGKSFNVVLENASESQNDAFLILDSTVDGADFDVGDRVIAVDASQSEAKPSYLTERADGDSPYAKEKVIATNAGWVFTPGNTNSGNDNKAAQPEVLVCSRSLQKSIDVPTPTHITLGSTTDKTAFFPDGDTFTGAASSTLGDVTAYIYFNEPIHVTGTPQLQLKQATALGSTFGTIMDYNSDVSVLSEGIMAFSLPASTDTRTSNVTNNTLGINSDDSISLNSGTIQKVTGGDKIFLESGTTALDDTDDAESFVILDGSDSSSRDKGGFLHGESLGMPADLTLTADADATMTVS